MFFVECTFLCTLQGYFHTHCEPLSISQHISGQRSASWGHGSNWAGSCMPGQCLQQTSCHRHNMRQGKLCDGMWLVQYCSMRLHKFHMTEYDWDSAFEHTLQAAPDGYMRKGVIQPSAMCLTCPSCLQCRGHESRVQSNSQPSDLSHPLRVPSFLSWERVKVLDSSRQSWSWSHFEATASGNIQTSSFQWAWP